MFTLFLIAVYSKISGSNNVQRWDRLDHLHRYGQLTLTFPKNVKLTFKRVKAMRLKKQYGILYSVYCLYSYSKISMSNPVFVLHYSIQYTVQIRKVKNV